MWAQPTWSASNGTHGVPMQRTATCMPPSMRLKREEEAAKAAEKLAKEELKAAKELEKKKARGKKTTRRRSTRMTTTERAVNTATRTIARRVTDYVLRGILGSRRR